MNRSLSKLVLHLLTFVLLAATTLVAQAPVPPAKPVPGEGAAGEWLGALDVGSVKLRLALHVEKKDDGSLGAVLDSIDQKAKIPVDTAVFEGRTLRLTLKAIGGSYEGTLNADGSALQGTWSQGGRTLPLTFDRQEKAFALNRPQEPKGPFPYASREVTFQSEAGGVQLAGTLLLPPGEGPFPAVALVTGSGPQDRDETLMGHKPFLVIADALARRGIASLRWDDRGAGASAGDHMGSTVDDFAADARAAVAFLRSRPEVDGNAIGIVGHSEGGSDRSDGRGSGQIRALPRPPRAAGRTVAVSADAPDPRILPPPGSRRKADRSGAGGSGRGPGAHRGSRADGRADPGEAAGARRDPQTAVHRRGARPARGRRRGGRAVHPSRDDRLVPFADPAGSGRVPASREDSRSSPCSERRTSRWTPE